MAVFLHKEIKKFSAVNDSEAHFMPGEKRHEMQRGGNEMPWMAAPMSAAAFFSV